MRTRWALLAVLAAAPGCRSRATAEDCAAMTEHYLDLAVRENKGAAGRTAAEAAAVREVERGLKRAVPGYRVVQDHCEAVTRAEVSCATGAETTQAWEACVQPADAR
jgi:hypothetical protein